MCSASVSPFGCNLKNSGVVDPQFLKDGEETEDRKQCRASGLNNKKNVVPGGSNF
jgi:hypothetical protein